MCTTLTGTHRCAEADLVVVPDLAMLHDVDKLAGSADLSIGFLHIVALGLDITTQRAQLAVRPATYSPARACDMPPPRRQSTVPLV